MQNVSINSTSEEVRSKPHEVVALVFGPVSINSTSEEVRSSSFLKKKESLKNKFPLIQLPRKSEALKERNGNIFEVSFH